MSAADQSGNSIAPISGSPSLPQDFGAQVVLVADLRGEEVGRAPALAELLEELGLPDAAAAVEDEELGLSGVGQLLEHGELALAADEGGR